MCSGEWVRKLGRELQPGDVVLVLGTVCVVVKVAEDHDGYHVLGRERDEDEAYVTETLGFAEGMWTWVE